MLCVLTLLATAWPVLCGLANLHPSHDDLGIPRHGFLGAGNFVFNQANRVYTGKDLDVSVLRYSTPADTTERLFWCTLAESRKAQSKDLSKQSCSLEFERRKLQDVITSLFSLRVTGAETGKHVVLANQNGRVFYFLVEVAEQIVPKSLDDVSAGPRMNQAMSRGYLKWCNEDLVVEFAAFNDRPHCGDDEDGQADPEYDEEQGKATLFKPNVRAAETPAYKCVLVETLIGTTYWFFGTKTESKTMRYLSVHVDECRDWVLSKRCRYGKLVAMDDRGQLTAYQNWKTNNREEYVYRWPLHTECTVHNCLLSQGFVRTQAPFKSLISSHLGRLPAGYAPGQSSPSYFSTTTGTLVWDRFEPKRLCYYAKHMSFDATKRIYRSADKADLVNFISDTTMTMFSSRQRNGFDPRTVNYTCLLAAARKTTVFYALNQDLVLAFTPGEIIDRQKRQAPSLEQAQLQYTYDALAMDLNRVKKNLAANWCRAQQNFYDLSLRGASIDPSSVFSSFYQRPVKAVLHGDLFAIHPCKIIRGSQVTLVPSLLTTHRPDLYRRMGIAVNEHRCFSRPLVSFAYYNETLYRQITPNFELSGLFPYTKACDGAHEFLFEIGDRYYHFKHYRLTGSHATADLLHHGKSVSCFLNRTAASSGTDCGVWSSNGTAPPSIRFIDTYTRLNQKLTEHLEFADIDPRLYNNTELKSYFSIMDSSTAIAFLQANKEAIYQYKSQLEGTSRGGGANYDGGKVYERVSSSVRDTTNGLLRRIGRGVTDAITGAFENAYFKLFLLVCSVGGAVQLLRLAWALLRPKKAVSSQKEAGLRSTGRLGTDGSITGTMPSAERDRQEGGAEGPDAEAMNSWWHWAGGKKEWEEPGVSKKDEDSSSVVERDYTLGWRTGSQRQRRGWWY